VESYFKYQRFIKSAKAISETGWLFVFLDEQSMSEASCRMCFGISISANAPFDTLRCSGSSALNGILMPLEAKDFVK
jgi:hypothetical protein